MMHDKASSIHDSFILIEPIGLLDREVWYLGSALCQMKGKPTFQQTGPGLRGRKTG